MDWSNERYVRLYTRDTTTWRVLSWEAQALLPMLLRLVDRAGVLDLGGVSPLEAISAALPKWPESVVQAGIVTLHQRGVIELCDDAVALPKFIEAQETPASDAQRQRDSRERRLAVTRSQNVLLRPAGEEPVTNRDGSSQAVTSRHKPSLLPSLTTPNQPSQADPNTKAPAASRVGSAELGLEARAEAINATAARYEIARTKAHRQPTAWDRHGEQVKALCNEVRLSLPEKQRPRVPTKLSVGGGGEFGAETTQNFEEAVRDHGIEQVLEIIEVTLRACAAGKDDLNAGKVVCMFRGAGWGAAVNRWEAAKVPKSGTEYTKLKGGGIAPKSDGSVIARARAAAAAEREGS